MPPKKCSFKAKSDTNITCGLGKSESEQIGKQCHLFYFLYIFQLNGMFEDYPTKIIRSVKFEGC